MSQQQYVPWPLIGRDGAALVMDEDRAWVLPQQRPCEDECLDLVWTGSGFARQPYAVVVVCRACLTPQPPVIWRD